MNDFKNIAEMERLTTAMLTQFGHAVFLSQIFEKSLISLLQGTFAYENKGKLPYETYLKEVAKIHRGNLGELLKRLKMSLNIDPEFETLLQKAKEDRNYLVHNYFYENESKKTVPDGCASIIQEMWLYQATFKNAIERVEILNRKMLEKIGVSREAFLAAAEKLRQEEVEQFRHSQRNHDRK